ncbi:MAG: LEA type 2 family protein [Halobacteriales archaeon]
MNVTRAIAVLFIVGIAIAAGLYVTGVIAPPSVTIEDEGDWGTVSEERMEIVTTLGVENPNPMGISIEEGVSASYRVSLNDVRVASGEHTGLDVPRGTSEMELSTYVDNDRIRPWWVAFVRADETLTVHVDGQVRAQAFGLSTATSFPAEERSMFEDETPVVDSMTAGVSELEGTRRRRRSGRGPQRRPSRSATRSNGRGRPGERSIAPRPRSCFTSVCTTRANGFRCPPRPTVSPRASR